MCALYRQTTFIGSTQAGHKIFFEETTLLFLLLPAKKSSLCKANQAKRALTGIQVCTIHAPTGCNVLCRSGFGVKPQKFKYELRERGEGKKKNSLCHILRMTLVSSVAGANAAQSPKSDIKRPLKMRSSRQILSQKCLGCRYKSDLILCRRKYVLVIHAVIKVDGCLLN